MDNYRKHKIISKPKTKDFTSPQLQVSYSMSTRHADMKTLINSLFVALVTFAYASVYWLGSRGSIGIMQDAGSLTSASYYKPFVYRALVPWLARLVASLGVRVDLALVLIVTASGVGFYLALRAIFADNPGAPAWVEPGLNLLRFYNHPARTLLHLAGTEVVLWMVAKDWTQKPALLRTAFIVMAPILTAFYLVLGQAFELRVFFEIYPVIVLLVVPARMSRIHERRISYVLKQQDSTPP